MRVRFRCPIRGDDRRLADDYCLPDFLFDRSPEKTKNPVCIWLPSRFSALDSCEKCTEKSANFVTSNEIKLTFGGFLGVGLRFTPLGEPSRLVAGRVAVHLQIIDSRHHLIHASAPRAFLVSACCSERSRLKYVQHSNVLSYN